MPMTTSATEDSNQDNPSSYTIESESTMSLKSRVVHESKMYLEMIEELGEWLSEMSC